MNGLAITPYMVGLDNEVTYLKGEVYFMKCIVHHLFDLGNKFLDGELCDIIKNVKSNSEKLDSKYKEAKEKEENGKTSK